MIGCEDCKLVRASKQGVLCSRHRLRQTSPGPICKKTCHLDENRKCRDCGRVYPIEEPRQADTAAHIERIAATLGIDAKCRLKHREGFEDGGEWFPPYDEYEIRAKGRVLNMDAEFVDRVTGRDAVFDLIVANLRHVFR